MHSQDMHIQHQYTVLCDLWCKKTCLVILIRSKIGSDSGDVLEYVVRDSNNSCKETEIKRESTKQTEISIWIAISYISSCLNDILHLCMQICSQIQEMFYACQSICIDEQFTTNIHVMGKQLMALYNIPLLLIQKERYLLTCWEQCTLVIML